VAGDFSANIVRASDPSSSSNCSWSEWPTFVDWKADKSLSVETEKREEGFHRIVCGTEKKAIINDCYFVVFIIFNGN